MLADGAFNQYLISQLIYLKRSVNVVHLLLEENPANLQLERDFIRECALLSSHFSQNDIFSITIAIVDQETENLSELEKENRALYIQNTISSIQQEVHKTKTMLRIPVIFLLREPGPKRSHSIRSIFFFTGIIYRLQKEANQLVLQEKKNTV